MLVCREGALATPGTAAKAIAPQSSAQWAQLRMKHFLSSAHSCFYAEQVRQPRPRVVTSCGGHACAWRPCRVRDHTQASAKWAVPSLRTLGADLYQPEITSEHLVLTHLQKHGASSWERSGVFLFFFSVNRRWPSWLMSSLELPEANRCLNAEAAHHLALLDCWPKSPKIEHT